LAVDTTIDKALDELLTRNETPWRVNALAFIKQGQKPDFIKKAGVEKIDPVDGVSRRAVLEILLSKIESKSAPTASKSPRGAPTWMSSFRDEKALIFRRLSMRPSTRLRSRKRWRSWHTRRGIA
jgi:hypothetical protein